MHHTVRDQPKDLLIVCEMAFAKAILHRNCRLDPICVVQNEFVLTIPGILA